MQRARHLVRRICPKCLASVDPGDQPKAPFKFDSQQNCMRIYPPNTDHLYPLSLQVYRVTERSQAPPLNPQYLCLEDDLEIAALILNKISILGVIRNDPQILVPRGRRVVRSNPALWQWVRAVSREGKVLQTDT